jgi:hypothetical protein
MAESRVSVRKDGSSALLASWNITASPVASFCHVAQRQALPLIYFAARLDVGGQECRRHE